MASPDLQTDLTNFGDHVLASLQSWYGLKQAKQLDHAVTTDSLNKISTGTPSAYLVLLGFKDPTVQAGAIDVVAHKLTYALYFVLADKGATRAYETANGLILDLSHRLQRDGWLYPHAHLPENIRGENVPIKGKDLTLWGITFDQTLYTHIKPEPETNEAQP